MDYLHARYYDPVVGVFLAADMVQGNAQGLNPYAYVNGNPETFSDPTGRYVAGLGGQTSYPPAPSSSPQPAGNAAGSGVFPWRFGNAFSSVGGGSARKFGNAFAGGGSTTSALSSCGGMQQSDCLQALWAVEQQVNLSIQVSLGGGCLGGIAGMALMTICLPGPGTTVNVSASVVTPLAGCASLLSCLIQDEGVDDSKGAEYDVYGEASGGCALSFTPTTVVATARGEQAIGTMKVGEQVWAYNPTTRKMELEPVLHVWINQDNDLVDLTLTSSTHLPHSGKLTQKSEVIHTNQKHPFLTREKGFLPVGQIKLGMHVLRADGTYGVVTGWKAVPGVKAMYNLEVAHDHTFTVGVGQWVVHNCTSTNEVLQKLENAGLQWGDDNHFANQFNARGGGLTADDVRDILVNGNPVKDEGAGIGNWGMMRYIGNKRYAIFFDGDGTLITFLTEKQISKARGRYWPILLSDLPVDYSWLNHIQF